MNKDQIYPLVTIILPIRNEAAFIASGLQAILEQDYPLEKLEVLIADGMSIDETRQIISEFSARFPELSIRVLDNPHQIVPTGINIALRRARGDIFIRVDGHCIIASDYVRCCVEHLLTGDVDGVGGPMETVGETLVATAIAAGMSSPFGVGNSAFRTMCNQNILTDTVPFPAYTRRITERAGLYDEELVRNQDDEYNYRIRKLGGKLLLAANVHSTYFSRSSLNALWRQYFQYGFWKVRVLQKHPRQMSIRQFIPPLFVLAMVVSILCALIPDLRILAGVAPGFYLAGNLAASLHTAYSRGWRLLPFLLLTYPILHFGYGSGFLAGIIHFTNRWGDQVGSTPNFGSVSRRFVANEQQTTPQ
jgi:succinoglycan biosynthesis protein ExoA